MKEVVIFMFLKAAELAIAWFMLWVGFWFSCNFTPLAPMGWPVFDFICLGLLPWVALGGISTASWHLIKLNWVWAKRIVGERQ